MRSYLLLLAPLFIFAASLIPVSAQDPAPKDFGPLCTWQCDCQFTPYITCFCGLYCDWA